MQRNPFGHWLIRAVVLTTTGSLVATCASEAPTSEVSAEVGVANLALSAPATVAAGNTVLYTIALSVPGGDPVQNAVLTFDLNDINDLPGAGDNGLNTDAEENYGTGGGLITTRPLEFVGASAGGPNATVPGIPGAGATAGSITWNLGTINSGFTGNLTVTLKAPVGIKTGATLNGRVRLVHSGGTVTANTASATTVTGPAPALTSFSLNTSITQVAPDSTFAVYPIFYNASSTNDVERVSVRISDDGGTCSARFSSMTANVSGNFTHARYTNPGAGNPVGTTGVLFEIDRVRYGMYSYNYLYSTTTGCAPGTAVKYKAETFLAGTLVDTRTITVPVAVQSCAWGNAYWSHRVQAQNAMPNGPRPYPAWPEYYGVIDGAVRPGEVYSRWTPLGGYGKSDGGPGQDLNVTLDAHYQLYTLSATNTFHGFGAKDNLSEAYKDCDNTGLLPTDPAFNHTTPTASGWSAVSIAATGVPFTAAPSESVADAVVPAGCRLLLVHRGERPGKSMSPEALFRVCDGSYGCAQPAAGSSGRSFVRLQDFTLYQGAAQACSDYGAGNTRHGAAYYVTGGAVPSVTLAALADQVPAGDAAVLEYVPETTNIGGEFTKGRWGVNLFGIRGSVNLDGVLGAVRATGFAIPPANQNVQGQSCDVNQIVFHPPSEAACTVATDAGCFAWWEIPDACQPTNAYGKRDASSYDRDDFRDYLRLRLTVPIDRTVSAGTVLPFVAEIRKTGVETVGWDNPPVVTALANKAVTSKTVNVTVTPAAAITLQKSGPSSWPPGATMYYTLRSTNVGNVPIPGIYVVDELPRVGFNGTTHAPTIGRAFSNLAAGSALIESSTTASCFSDPLAATWTQVGTAMVASTLAGYAEMTDANVPAGARCVRARLKTGRSLASGAAWLVALEATLVGADNGDTVFNQALTGASSTLQGTVSLPSVTSNLTSTAVSNSAKLSVSKTYAADPTRAGYIKWTLKYRNASGAVANNVSLIDNLPAQLIYDGTDAATITAGESCTDGPTCPVQNAGGGGVGGQVRYTIATLAADDGVPDAGPDEGTISLWTKMAPGTPAGTSIENCGEATAAGVQSNGPGCASITYLNVAISKSIVGNPTMVAVGDTIQYQIVATNNTSGLVTVRLVDTLAAELTYTAGTLKVNGATASDSNFSGQTLDYTYPLALAPSEAVTVTYDVVLASRPASGSLTNVVTQSGCVNPVDPATCGVANEGTSSLPVTICGDGVVGGSETCDDGGTANGNGCSATCRVESGYVCSGAPSTCNTVCGDGVKAGTEACDDGNTTGSDGCSAACAVEPGYTCVGTTPSVCSTTCGDGVPAGAEACDDGNTTSGDGCNATCAVETFFQCSGTPSVCVLKDTDGDGVRDNVDNCITVANPAQTNTDGAADGGDACDSDDDNDGVADTTDNCPLVSNAAQTNTDGAADGGDACDSDDDNDGVADTTDNCPLISNAAQTNTDGAADGGDACDSDDDNDGVADTTDNCPLISNAAQTNTDGAADGGDACDSDDDNDGVADTTDNCPLVSNATQANTDGAADGGDACDSDDDNDGVADTTDNCPLISNAAQTNTDGAADGGDVCDADDDDDGVADASDNCPLVMNADQLNTDEDRDGGDACDTDDDNDGVADANDNCPLTRNADQANNDSDAQGDICDDDDDNDGATDGDEVAAGTDPVDADTDNDGVADGEEGGVGGGVATDSDGDGLVNALDPDSDNDGILDGTERGLVTPGVDTDVTKGNFVADADGGVSTTNPLVADTDGGGVRDGAEDANHNGQIDAGETNPNDAGDDAMVMDTDGDGLSDAEERVLGTNPNDADSDDDGVADGAEPNYAHDSDGDGLVNALDPDSDNDGLYDGTELGVTAPGAATNVAAGHFIADADGGATRTNPLLADTDTGGVPDGMEDTNRNGMVDADERNPNDGSDDLTGQGTADADADGLSDAQELLLGTDPADADSDEDGVLDGQEPNFADDTDGDGLINALDADSDADGLFDGTELGIVTPPAATDVSAGVFIADADPSTTTSAVDADSDNGGVPDGIEDANRDGAVDPGETNPRVAADDNLEGDRDGDGIKDVEEGAGDIDDDGVPNFLDADSDGDGISDRDEAGDADLATPAVDTDNDGTPDYRDMDSDNDTISDRDEAGDADLETAPADADNDGTPNYRDMDSDNDTISDRDEAGDGDVLTAPVNTDGVDAPDYLDVDADDDGEFDSAEAGDTDLGTAPVDTDGDLVGDWRDTDSDNDGVLDATDNCRLVMNPDQADSNNDGTGNACQDDADGDGVRNDVDNCPLVGNADQLNTDGTADGGDACDSDDDNDTVADDTDNCPLTANPDQTNTDTAADGGDACDADDDNDAANDDADNCPHVANADQKDTDGDRAGDACDTSDDRDADGDGIRDNAPDNCVAAANPDQADTDSDGVGDACDPHTDANQDGFDDNVGVAGGGCAASHGQAGGQALLWLVLAFGMVVRRRATRASRGPRHAWANTVAATSVAAAATVCVSAPHAQAQAIVEERDFSVERMTLASDRRGILNVESGPCGAVVVGCPALARCGERPAGGVSRGKWPAYAHWLVGEQPGWR